MNQIFIQCPCSLFIKKESLCITGEVSLDARDANATWVTSTMPGAVCINSRQAKSLHPRSGKRGVAPLWFAPSHLALLVALTAPAPSHTVLSMAHGHYNRTGNPLLPPYRFCSSTCCFFIFASCFCSSFFFFSRSSNLPLLVTISCVFVRLYHFLWFFLRILGPTLL